MTTERAYFGYEAELRAEIERLRKALLVAESCAALSGIGVDAHMCAVELGKETMGKLIAAEKLNAELVAALELLADSKTAYGDIARAALAKVKGGE